MRILVQGMQSSGASLFATLLAQRPGCLALIDIFASHLAPTLDTGRDVVAKAVVSTAFSLAQHSRRFRPDRRVLFLRHPGDTFASLVGKFYANEGGPLDQKFALLERLFAKRESLFDAVVHYETLVTEPESVVTAMQALGWDSRPEHLALPRSPAEIEETNWREEPAAYGRARWGFGNQRPGGIGGDRLALNDDAALRRHLDRLCPRLNAHYDRLIDAHPAWRDNRAPARPVPLSPPLLPINLDRLIRLARIALAANQPAEADGWVAQALALDGGSTAAWRMLGQIFDRPGGRDELAARLQAGAARLRGRPRAEVLVQLAELQLRRRRHDEALATLRAALEEDPALGGAQRALAEVLLQRGEAAAALAAAEQAVALLPADGDALACRGLALAALDRPDEAERDLRRAVALNPRRPAQREALARFLERHGRLDEAGDALRDLPARR